MHEEAALREVQRWRQGRVLISDDAAVMLAALWCGHGGPPQPDMRYLVGAGEVTPVDSMGRVWEQDADHLGAVEWGHLDQVSIDREKFNEHPLPGMVAEAMDSVQGRIDGADD